MTSSKTGASFLAPAKLISGFEFSGSVFSADKAIKMAECLLIRFLSFSGFSAL